MSRLGGERSCLCCCLKHRIASTYHSLASTGIYTCCDAPSLLIRFASHARRSRQQPMQITATMHGGKHATRTIFAGGQEMRERPVTIAAGDSHGPSGHLPDGSVHTAWRDIAPSKRRLRCCRRGRNPARPAVTSSRARRRLCLRCVLKALHDWPEEDVEWTAGGRVDVLRRLGSESQWTQRRAL